MLRKFLEDCPAGAVLDDGQVLFDLAETQARVTAGYNRCTLQLWSGDRNLVCSVLDITARGGLLRVSTQRLGQPRAKTLVLSPILERREPRQREPQRQHYLKLLERMVSREFRDWTAEGFRTAMDLERSFGPAYARGSLVRGKEAWAVIGVGARESQATIDGVLTLGILWLHHCRERGDGQRLYKGLRVVVPRGCAQVTLARLPWLSAGAQWELLELDEADETLTACDPADQGNLRTLLVHHPDRAAAQERFARAVAAVLALVPGGEEARVEQRLRSASELSFLLHGLEFARARISLAPNSFAQVLSVTVGTGASETLLTEGNAAELGLLVADLFQRRRALSTVGSRVRHPQGPGRSIGAFTGQPAHRRQMSATLPCPEIDGSPRRAVERDRASAAQQDPLYRAAPERWLESVLHENLAPLTRSLAPQLSAVERQPPGYANDPAPDTFGNRETPHLPDHGWRLPARTRKGDCLIPRFDPRFVYTQVPAIAGASDRGLLDLLGMTDDGRLAVMEIKVADDLQLPMQGLDYWIRVRHHHASSMAESGEGTSAFGSDLQRHGYFPGVQLSPLPPRLYLVAPALHVHPATETILRYLSPRVEWHLLALDERWRQEIRVVWRKSGGSPARSGA